jgi:mRNA-degrading endonuclease RelE of RelBE toxin-antitoxin system
MPYTIRVASRAVEKQLATVPEEAREHVISRIRSLADQPRPKGIKAIARDVYRLRIGRYRVIYKILGKEEVILIGKVALRTERTFKGLEELF